jgi:hypothetical protein
MPLAFEFSNKEDLIYPILLCDHCGKQITDARAANVLWDKPEFEGKGPWRTDGVYFVHKECDQPFRQSHDSTYWNDLTLFPAQLCFHMGMEPAAKRIMNAEVRETKRQSAPRRKQTSGNADE